MLHARTRGTAGRLWPQPTLCTETMHCPRSRSSQAQGRVHLSPPESGPIFVQSTASHSAPPAHSPIQSSLRGGRADWHGVFLSWCQLTSGDADRGRSHGTGKKSGLRVPEETEWKSPVPPCEDLGCGKLGRISHARLGAKRHLGAELYGQCRAWAWRAGVGLSRSRAWEGAGRAGGRRKGT